MSGGYTGARMMDWTVNTYTVIIERVGTMRLGAMRAIRRARPDVTLSEARAFVTNLPSTAIHEGDAQDAFPLAWALAEADCDVRVMQTAREYPAGCWAGDEGPAPLSETVQEVPRDWWVNF